MKISDKLFLIKRDLKKKLRISEHLERVKSKDKQKDKSKFNLKSKLKFDEISLNSLTKNSLLYFSLIISIAGLVFLIILSSFISPKLVLIENLKSMKDGSYVSFAGYITSIKETDAALQLTVCDSPQTTEKISSSKTTSQKQSFSNSVNLINCVDIKVLTAGYNSLLIGDFVSVIGKISSFNGKQYVLVSSTNDIKQLS
jgi:hypothetical protein